MSRWPVRSASPNGKLQHAAIGVAGVGAGDLQNFLQHSRVQMVALCDVDQNHTTWVFHGNNLSQGDELVVERFDGEFPQPEEIRTLYSVTDYPPESSMLIGTEGAMLLGIGTSPLSLPEERFKGLSRPKFEARNHYHHFAEACLGAPKTESHVCQTGPVTEAILLGSVAIHVQGEKLEWEAKGLKIRNHRAAQKLLRRCCGARWEV